MTVRGNQKKSRAGIKIRSWFYHTGRSFFHYFYRMISLVISKSMSTPMYVIVHDSFLWTTVFDE